MRRSSILLVLAIVPLGCSAKSSGGSGGASFDASGDGPGFDSSMEDAGDAGTCQAPGVSATCTACVASHCASQSTAAQSACAAVISCYCMCAPGDASCVQACGTGVTSSCVSSACALSGCAAASCASECTIIASASCTSDAGGPDAAGDAPSADASDAATMDTGTDAPAEASPVACTGDGGISTLWTQPFERPQGIAVDATNVYWVTTNNTLAVLTTPLCGGAVTTVATSTQTPAYLAVAGGVAYFSVPVPGVIMSVPVTGGTPATFAQDVNGTTEMIVVDSTNVYWADTNNPQGGGIVSKPIAGGAQTTLFAGDGPQAVAQDATSLYWVGGATGQVKKIAKTGGTPVTLATGPTGATWVATDGTNVYWDPVGISGIGSVLMVPVTGGTPTTLATSQSAPFGLAVDSTDVYWALDQTAGAIVSVPISGGTPTTLVTGQNYASLLAVTGTTLYWTDLVGDSVMALTPK